MAQKHFPAPIMDHRENNYIEGIIDRRAETTLQARNNFNRFVAFKSSFRLYYKR